MSERIEFHGDTSPSEIVPGVAHSRETRTPETKKAFAAELDKRLAREKDKSEPPKEKEEDEIIIHNDNEQPDNDAANNNNEEQKSDSQEKSPALGDIRGNRINLLA